MLNKAGSMPEETRAGSVPEENHKIHPSVSSGKLLGLYKAANSSGCQINIVQVKPTQQ